VKNGQKATFFHDLDAGVGKSVPHPVPNAPDASADLRTVDIRAASDGLWARVEEPGKPDTRGVSLNPAFARTLERLEGTEKSGLRFRSAMFGGSEPAEIWANSGERAVPSNA
jgi:hypothetical protein